MKKIGKNILIFILGGIIFSVVSVYAAISISANNITLSSNKTSKTNVKDSLDELYDKATNKLAEAEAACPSGKVCTAAKFKLGDYVQMTPTLSNYSISTTDTGYTSAQTINPSELNLWRVISINSDGTVDMVSEYVSSTDVTFKGKTGYQNYIGTLNKIAASYTNPKYVLRTRHMGYGGGTANITDITKLDQTTAPWASSTSSSTTLADEQLGAGDMGYEADYYLVKNVLGTTVANKVGTATSTKYWLASRRYIYRSSASWDFRARYVSTSGSADSDNLYNHSSSGFRSDSNYNAIRPIMTLKSGLTPTGGDGSTYDKRWILS